MIEQVRKFILSHELITSGTRQVFAAVSGGIDSCVLLDVLYRLKDEIGIRLGVLHFNHHQRGNDSRADAAFVKALAEKYRADFKSGELRKKNRRMSENLLREERYRFFERALESRRDAVIATGHNRDDQIETFLMRLVRGSRLKGLQGIPAKRGVFIRPLLEISRREIEKYARENDLQFREDRSNADESMTRNRLRHNVIPFLQQNLEPRLMENLQKTMKDLEQHYSLYTSALRDAVLQSCKKLKEGIVLNRKRYEVFNPVIRRGLLEYCISSVIPLNYSLSDRNFAVWDEFVTAALPGKEMHILNDGIALADRTTIVFGGIPQEKEEKYSLTPGDTLVINDKYRIRLVKTSKRDVHFSADKNIEFIDGGETGPRLTVRFWKQGDNFRPLGMMNRRKLSDFFIDLKLNRFRKKQVPIICSGSDIVWIAGFRLDDKFKVTYQTKIFYRLELEEIEH